MSKCVFAGTFDPFTIGHKQIVEKCLEMFDEVVVAILKNNDKNTVFDTTQRQEMINAVYKDNKRVKVVVFDGLLVELLKKENTNIYVRGVRNYADYNYETEMYYINKDLYGEILTLYIPTDKEYLHISSSMVKTLMSFGKEVDKYLPIEILPLVKKYYKGN